MLRVSKRKAADTTAAPRQASPKRSAKLKLIVMSDLDGRTVAARRIKEIVGSISADLGGASGLGEAQRQLITRAALLSTILESAETKLLVGEEIDLTTYLSAIDRLRRVLTALGLERKARDVSTLTPLQYAQQQSGARS
jgi:hypothetical protein